MAGLIIYNSSTITDGCLALIGHFYTTIDTIHIEVGPIGAEFSLCVMRVANDNFRSCRAHSKERWKPHFKSTVGYRLKFHSQRVIVANPEQINCQIQPWAVKFVLVCVASGDRTARLESRGRLQSRLFITLLWRETANISVGRVFPFTTCNKDDYKYTELELTKRQNSMWRTVSTCEWLKPLVGC